MDSWNQIGVWGWKRTGARSRWSKGRQYWRLRNGLAGRGGVAGRLELDGGVQSPDFLRREKRERKKKKEEDLLWVRDEALSRSISFKAKMTAQGLVGSSGGDGFGTSVRDSSREGFQAGVSRNRGRRPGTKSDHSFNEGGIETGWRTR